MPVHNQHYIDQRGVVVKYTKEVVGCNKCCYVSECQYANHYPARSVVAAFKKLPSPIELASCSVGVFKEVKN